MVLARAGEQQDNLTIVAFRCDGVGGAAAAPGTRSRVALIAACLMLCANIYAGKVAWQSWRTQIPGAAGKPIGGNSGHAAGGTSSTPAKTDATTDDGGAKGQAGGQEDAGSDTSDKLAGSDTAAKQTPDKTREQNTKNTGRHKKAETKRP